MHSVSLARELNEEVGNSLLIEVKIQNEHTRKCENDWTKLSLGKFHNLIREFRASLIFLTVHDVVVQDHGIWNHEDGWQVLIIMGVV